MFIFLHLIFTSFSFLIIYYFCPYPFIDEVFHLNQYLEYCKGNFTYWDTKITTLPGLYLWSLFFVSPFQFVKLDICTLFTARLLNYLSSLAIPVVIHSILAALNPHQNSRRLLIQAISLSNFPVLVTFHSFYYTEVLSVLLVLLTFHSHLRDRHGLACVTGALSFIVRQDNLIWFVFVTILRCYEILCQQLHLQRSNTCELANLKCIGSHLASTRQALHTVRLLLSHLRAYLCVFLAVSVFLVYNGGRLVVGDHHAHRAILHPAQIVYLMCTMCFFWAPLIVCSLPQICRHMRYNVFTYGLVAALGAALLALVLLAPVPPHAYNLADNRHVTFYLRRLYLLSPTLAPPIAPIPTALTALGCCTLLLACVCVHSHTRSRLLCVCAAFCCVCHVLPRHLVDMRYFILPHLVVRLIASTPPSPVACHPPAPVGRLLAVLAHYANRVPVCDPACCELVFNLGVSAIMLVIFTSKSFYWDDISFPQRIIW